MLKLRLAPLAGTRLQAMEDDPAASEQVLAAAQQAQANFEALQSFSRQFETLLPSTAASPKWEDFDYRSADRPRTLDEMSPCTTDVGEVEGTDMDVIEGFLATLETQRASALATLDTASALQPTPTWGSSTTPEAASAPALLPTPKWGSATMPQAAAASALEPTPQASASSSDGMMRLDEQWRSRPGHPSGGRYGNRGGKNKEWYAAQYKW